MRTGGKKTPGQEETNKTSICDRLGGAVCKVPSKRKGVARTPCSKVGTEENARHHPGEVKRGD